ncbi:hypothetical protein J4Q44_G00363360 [Coregonus suidteri]|uniref:Uncharacterized protein n=1 Tax=Coregonus suidteri TaxID=861788 RepID=A0AAN8Q6F2_9TELE
MLSPRCSFYTCVYWGSLWRARPRKRARRGATCRRPSGPYPLGLQRDQTGVLLSTVLHAVHCAEWTGGSQELCDREMPPIHGAAKDCSWARELGL